MNSRDILTGGVLHCIEASTLGLPFEVWKTHACRYRNETTVDAFRNIWASGGLGAFYRGFGPKMVESFSKGGVLLFFKEGIMNACDKAGMGAFSSGLLGGFGGGVSQTIVMGPCTFLVTAAVTGNTGTTAAQQMAATYKQHGIAGFYRGSTALALRQGSNWASRQGFTDAVREQVKKVRGKDTLSVGDEALCGTIGGTLSTWNQPVEVLRVEAQAAAVKGLPQESMVSMAKRIVAANGVAGLFTGLAPRVLLCVNQTLFLVTVPRLLKTYGYF